MSIINNHSFGARTYTASPMGAPTPTPGNPWAAVMPRSNEGYEATLDQVQLNSPEAIALPSPAPEDDTRSLGMESLQRTAAFAATAAAPFLAPAIRLILLGQEQSSKEEQAKKLAEEFEVPHIQMGKLIKQEIESGSELGSQLAKELENGNESPSQLVRELLEKRLQQPDVSAGFVLDAYPSDLADKKSAELAKQLQDLKIVELAPTGGNCPTCIPAVESVRERGDYFEVEDSGDAEEVGDMLGALAMNFQAPQVQFVKA